MATRIAINGFGRIGRLFFRAICEQGLLGKEIEVVAVNDLVPADNLAYLLKYDSVFRRFDGAVEAEGDDLVVNGQKIKVLSERSPADLPWSDLGVELAVECTGLFVQDEKAQMHLDAGAKRVLISAPGKGDGIKTLVLGVNEETYDPSVHRLISNASCTTNCLAPVVKVLLDAGFGLAEGLMTTIHAYTANQSTVDAPSKKDFKRGRAAALSVIPTTTGAAKAVGLVLPETQGKLTGMAFRVPTPTSSVVDLTVRTERDTSLADINAAMKKASEGKLKGYLGYTEDPVVSSDFIGDHLSSIYDATAGIELNSRFFKLISWYDNEMGYSNRLVDLVGFLAGKGL